MIANLEEGAGDAGHPITATVAANGRFTITNARNNFSKTYTANWRGPDPDMPVGS